MKSQKFLVLLCLAAGPAFSQVLPDEINFPPYESRFQNLDQNVRSTESELQQNRRSLAEVEKYIREMTSHLSGLEQSIRDSHAQITYHQQMIPALQRDLSQQRALRAQLAQDIRQRQQETSQLEARLLHELRILRPMEDHIQRLDQRARGIQNEIAQLQRQEREVLTRLNRAEAEVVRITRLIEAEQAEQRQLQAEYRTLDARIARINGDISQLEGQIQSQNASLQSERQKFAALEERVREYTAEVAKLRGAGAPAAEIAAAERKLTAATSKRDSTAGEVRSLEGSIVRLQNQVREKQGRIEQERREHAAIPARLQRSEAKERNLARERSDAAQSIGRINGELAQVNQNIRIREGALAAAINDLRNEERSILRQRQLVENLQRSFDVARGQVSQLSQQNAAVEQNIVALDRSIGEHQAALPRFEASIRQSQREITEGQRELAQARTDEQSFLQSIGRQESKLAQLRTQRAEAQGQMNQRRSLYDNYLVEARTLGASQTSNAQGLGATEGDKLSEQLSRQNGTSAGRELGLAEAKYWGLVRGELAGHAQGYQAGRASEADRTRGELEGETKARSDAHLQAQTMNKPVYFEELLLEEFRKPLPQKGLGLKALFSPNFELALVADTMDTVPPLSPMELDASAGLPTILDESIGQMANSVKSLEQRARELADPRLAFQRPAQIPLGRVNCAQVYKNVQAFKSACEQEYRDVFSQNYVEGARGAFSDTYSQRYERDLHSVRVSEREKKYAAELATATKVGFSEGEKLGKQEVFDETYAVVYRRTHATELPLAQARARVDAANELSQFRSANPLLTLVGQKFEAQEFRGGEEVRILGQVKNISPKAFSGAVVFKVTQIENGELTLREAVLNQAAGLALTNLPELKLKVSPKARAGDKLVVKGLVSLPGDRYKPAREERFELVQTLAANPANSMAVEYLKYPSIRSIFRRHTHWVSIKIAPTVEAVEGYRLTLTPVGDSAQFINLSQQVSETGALQVGQEKSLDFSYTFPNEAKGQTVQLELVLSFNGKVLKKELIETFPN